VNAILLVIPASFLLQDAWQGMGEYPGIRTYLFVKIIATNSIAIVVTIFQTMISSVIVLKNTGMCALFVETFARIPGNDMKDVCVAGGSKDTKSN
ncbi:unnamed protein product, partial [Allacma fusca]